MFANVIWLMIEGAQTKALQEKRVIVELGNFSPNPSQIP